MVTHLSRASGLGFPGLGEDDDDDGCDVSRDIDFLCCKAELPAVAPFNSAGKDPHLKHKASL